MRGDGLSIVLRCEESGERREVTSAFFELGCKKDTLVVGMMTSAISLGRRRRRRDGEAGSETVAGSRV